MMSWIFFLRKGGGECGAEIHHHDLCKAGREEPDSESGWHKGVAIQKERACQGRPRSEQIDTFLFIIVQEAGLLVGGTL